MIQEHPHEAPDAAPLITGIYAKLPAQDVERARAFYAEKLGLTPVGERHNHLYYKVGNVYFIIFPSTGAPSGTHDQLGLIAEDLVSEVQQLKSRGVTFESYPPPPGAIVSDSITDMGQVRAAWFKDSEGNLLSIAEFPSGSPFGG